MKIKNAELGKMPWKGPVCAPLALWQICFLYDVIRSSNSGEND